MPIENTGPGGVTRSGGIRDPQDLKYTNVEPTYNDAGTGLLQADGTPLDASVTVTGGTIDGAAIGGTTPAAVKCTTLTALGDVALGDAAADLVGFHGVSGVAQASAYTQTYATASKTHAAFTATSIAAAVPAAAPAGGTGAAAGAWDTAANRDAAIVTINDLRTHAIEMDLDYEALLVDVTNLKQVVNALIDDLQAKGLAA